MFSLITAAFKKILPVLRRYSGFVQVFLSHDRPERGNSEIDVSKRQNENGKEVAPGDPDFEVNNDFFIIKAQRRMLFHRL